MFGCCNHFGMACVQRSEGATATTSACVMCVHALLEGMMRTMDLIMQEYACQGLCERLDLVRLRKVVVPAVMTHALHLPLSDTDTVGNDNDKVNDNDDDNDNDNDDDNDDNDDDNDNDSDDSDGDDDNDDDESLEIWLRVMIEGVK